MMKDIYSNGLNEQLPKASHVYRGGAGIFLRPRKGRTSEQPRLGYKRGIPSGSHIILNLIR